MSRERARRAAAVCVYCGSRLGARPAFAAAARALGAGLAGLGLRVVYGAGDLGLMGEVSTAARAAGGATFGVIPRGLWEREVGARALPDVVVTESLQQRKALMLENADAAVVLPGGIGTLDELVEALSWRHLGLHRKPVLLLDIEGYWRPLLTLFDQMRAADLLHRPLEGDLEVHAEVDSALTSLATRFEIGRSSGV